jgi:hypothetical protein
MKAEMMTGYDAYHELLGFPTDQITSKLGSGH